MLHTHYTTRHATPRRTDGFVGKLPRLLQSKSPAILEHVLSLLWVLVYDSEKVKVALRRQPIRGLVEGLLSAPPSGGSRGEVGVPSPLALEYAAGVIQVL